MVQKQEYRWLGYLLGLVKGADSMEERLKRLSATELGVAFQQNSVYRVEIVEFLKPYFRNMAYNLISEMVELAEEKGIQNVCLSGGMLSYHDFLVKEIMQKTLGTKILVRIDDPGPEERDRRIAQAVAIGASKAIASQPKQAQTPSPGGLEERGSIHGVRPGATELEAISYAPSWADREAAVQKDLKQIARSLKEKRKQTTLFGLGSEEIQQHGPLLVDFVDRLKKFSDIPPLLVLIGENAPSFRAHVSVLVAEENPFRAAVALKGTQSIFGVERLDYLASPEEVELLTRELVSIQVPIAVTHSTTQSFRFIFRHLLSVLAGLDPAIDQTEANAFYGIDLSELAENLELLAQLGV